MSEISAASIIHRTNEKRIYNRLLAKNAAQALPICARQSCTAKNSFYGSRKITRQPAAEPQAKKFLDIGCGAAFLAFCWGKKHSVTGIDLTRK